MKNGLLRIFALSLLLVVTFSFSAYADYAQRSRPLKKNAGAEFDKTIRERYKKDEVLVKFRPGAPEKDKENLHKAQGAKKIKEFSSLRIHVIKIKKNMTVEEAIERYHRNPLVEYAEPNFVVTAEATPDDLRFNEQWALHNTGQNGGTTDADIDAPEAWNITTGSSDVVVAVIDTGVDYAHPDLDANMWVNPGEIPGNGVDDDGNGYVDDSQGINAITGSGDPWDDEGHGTHVAGILGAAGNNTLGVTGVAWNVKILACKFLDAFGSGDTADAIECLQYVKALRNRGVNVIATNNSWGCAGNNCYSQALYDAINEQKEVLFIAAAGNGGKDGIGDSNDTVPHYPSNYTLPNIIAVAATDRYDSKASFSNFGRRTVGLGAPGVDILSTLRYSNYGTNSGTSMAAPQVTGVAALLRAQDAGRDSKTLRNLILAGGDSLLSLSSTTITGKRLNAYGSLNCSNAPLLSPLAPPQAPLAPGTPVTLYALSIDCALPVGPMTTTTAGGTVVDLLDDGVTPDLLAGDGIFTGTWTPTREGEVLSFSSLLGTEAVTIYTPPEITTRYLPEGQRLSIYSQSVTVEPGVAPYAFAISAGALPPGLNLDLNTGAITGTPSVAGTFTFTVQVTDSWSPASVVTKQFSLKITDHFIAERWGKTFDRKHADYTTDIATDTNGNVYVIGESYNGYDDDIVLIKYSPDGTVLWSKTFDSGSMDYKGYVAIDGLGNIYATWFSYWPWYDIIIKKFDPDGNETWTDTFDDGFIDIPGGIAVDSDGNILIAGQSSDGYDYDLLTIKYTPSGTVAWTTRYDGMDEDYAVGVAVDSSGNSYVAGYSLTGLTYNPVTIKYDASGSEVWKKVYDKGVNYYYEEGGIAVDGSGNVYVACSAGIWNGPSFEDAYLTLKYDSNGALQWSQVYGDINMTATDIAVDGSGNSYVTGFSDNGTTYDFFTVKYSPSGEVLWTKTSDGQNDDFALGVAVDSSGTVSVTGSSYSGAYDDFLTISYQQTADPFRITASPLLPGTVGLPYTVQMTATAGTPSYLWSVFSGSLPDGITLNSSGELSGTPVLAGSYAFTVRATDASGATADKAFTLTLYDPLIITTTSLAEGTVSAAYSQTLAATGGRPPYTWSIASGALPGGLALSSSTGTISGTPTAAGPFTFTVQARDVNGTLATASLSITIYSQPSITTVSLPAGTVGTPYSQTLAATGGKTPYTWSITSGSLPAGVTLDSASGTIAGTPSASGTFTFTVKVTDAHLAAASKSFYITITYLPVRIAGTPERYFSTLQSAYNDAASGNTIQSQAATFAENLQMNLPYSITLKGGYNTNYTSNTSFTNISGSLTISDGTVTIENVLIR